MPSILIYTYLMLIAGASTKLFVFVTTAIYIITLLLVFGAFKIKDYIFDSILKQIVSIIVIVIIIILLAKIQYYLSNNIVKLMIKLFSISILISFVIPLGFLLYMHEIYQTGEYRLILSGFIVAIQVYFFVTITDNIANNFEIANVKYKYLSIEKSVASALPEKICKNAKNKNCDFNKTYYDENETSGVMKLYNIKALSTLGKFYYLETIGYKNKNDKEIKFELDASKIISREKQER
ncbi:hypothetical protein [Campylobacter concisus]|uniref:hypothetical protein n=1 Tax=Campylobacter concisus TaxID=199 RepID=UPI000CD9D6C5|nr:hypothetical protein [Campylobacter concisus]